MSTVFDNTEVSGKNFVNETGGARDMVFAKPSNVVDGDDMLIVIAIDGSANSTVTWTPAAGWTQVVDYNDTGASARPIIGAWKRTAASEGASYTFSYAAATGTLTNAGGAIMRVTGANAATFEDAADTVNEQTTTASPTAPSITTATANAMLLAITAVNDGRQLASPDSGYPTGFTGIYARSVSVSSASPVVALAFKEQAVAGASGTAQFTGLLSTATGQNTRSVMFAIRPAVSAGTTITAVGDTTPYHGQTSITVTGTNFNAAQGDGEIYVCSANDPDHVSAVNQTVTAWSDTSITITMVLDSFDFDTDLYLFVRNSDEEEGTSGFVIQRSAVISITKTLETKGGAAQASVTDINWAVYEDVTLETLLERGTGESTNGSGSLVINLTEQGGLDPNAADPVYLVLSKDGAVGSELFGAVKVVPTYA